MLSDVPINDVTSSSLEDLLCHSLYVFGRVNPERKERLKAGEKPESDIEQKYIFCRQILIKRELKTILSKFDEMSF